MDPGAAAPPCLQLLAPAVLAPRLDAPELCRLLATCRLWGHSGAVVAHRWNELGPHELLRRDLCGASAAGGPGEYLSRAAAPCERCRGALWVRRRGGWRRCLCVPWRGARLPLTVVSLDLARCGDGSFCEWAGHSQARAATSCLFDARFVAVDRLRDADLVGADLLVLHTTSAQEGLSREEQESAARYLQGGGTALINCFSNWTSNGGAAREVTAFLGGVRPIAGSRFGGATRRLLREDPGAACADLCLAGPRGPAERCARYGATLGVAEAVGGLRRRAPPRAPGRLWSFGGPKEPPGAVFSNFGETEFDASEALSSGAAVSLCEDSEEEASAPASRRTAPLWFPAACGAGQALLCSNMHFVADPAAWNGGFVQDAENVTLFLNLCAAACRAL